MHIVFVRARRCQQAAGDFFKRLQAETDALGITCCARGVGDFHGCLRQLHRLYISQRELRQPAPGKLVLLRGPDTEAGALQQMFHDNGLVGDQLIDAGITNGMRQLLC